MEDFDQRLDFLDRSGIEQARFLGGEPTLHPQFPELIKRALARNKKIIVFTNGWMPPASRAALEDMPPEQCSIILNISATGNSAGGPDRVRHQRELLKRLGPKVQPGFNIYQTNQPMHWIIDLISGSGCKQAIRMGVAQPVLEGQNVFLPTRHYREVGDQIVQFASTAGREGIKIELDCGFVRCMFTDAGIQRLADLEADLAWRCSPILDIDIDGKIFHCFPLAVKVQSQLESAITASDLRNSFSRWTNPYRQVGIFKECSICSYKQEQTCSGGCLSNIIQRFSTQPFHFSM